MVVKNFAQDRHSGVSFSYLKENGELLSIIRNTGLKLSNNALRNYINFYEKIPVYLDLYPAFYRFFYAISLDLEDLGLSGRISELLRDYVLSNDLHVCETSDVRRMEIRNLLGRSNTSLPAQNEKDLIKRSQRFLENTQNFQRYNKPLFYDVTHLIFFQTNLGKDLSDLEISPALKDTLQNIACLAYLDDDIDLLAEVCLCYKYLGLHAPLLWVEACVDYVEKFSLDSSFFEVKQTLPVTDDYHIYLVTNWMIANYGKTPFLKQDVTGPTTYTKPKLGKSVLWQISKHVHSYAFMTHSSRPSAIIKAEEIFNTRQKEIWEKTSTHTPELQKLLQELTKGLII